jgi:hypothetical protein
MPRGRPAKAPTRSLNIRVDVDDLDMLALIQTATKVPTADVVRKFLTSYIEQNKDTLRIMGEHLKQGHHWGGVPMSSSPYRADISREISDELDAQHEREGAEGGLSKKDD